MNVTDVSRRIPRGRARLAQVLRAAPQLIRAGDVERVLGVDRAAANQLLARWHDQGHLRRVSHGVYAPIPVTRIDLEQVLDDPWVLVPELFAPAYVGGWSAAEHWDLTEQLFRSICVLTTRKLRRSEMTAQGVSFVARRMSEERMFGLAVEWRGAMRVAVSDAHKTIIDMMFDPALGGGAQHAFACFTSYLGRSDADLDVLLDYAARMRSGVTFKRLGFLAERAGLAGGVLDACREGMSQGVSALDPRLPRDRVITRWRLAVPASWARDD